MSDAPRNNFQPQGTGPSPLGISKPQHSEASHFAKPSAIKSLSKMGFRMWLGMVLLVVLTVGGVAAAYLSTVSQDLRQQASGGVKPAYLIVGSGTPVPTPRLGVGANCTQVSKNASGNYCADARLGNCLKCNDNGIAEPASDAACNGMPCGSNVQLTQAAGSKCSGSVTQGTVACADSEKVSTGNCKKCEYDKNLGYAVYKDVGADECLAQSLICGATATPAPKPPTSTPKPVASVSPVGSVSVSPGVSGAPTLTKIPTATKVPTVTPNLFAGVTGVGVGGSDCSPSNKCLSGY